jgi:hypothetical protein
MWLVHGHKGTKARHWRARSSGRGSSRRRRCCRRRGGRAGCRLRFRGRGRRHVRRIRPHILPRAEARGVARNRAFDIFLHTSSDMFFAVTPGPSAFFFFFFFGPPSPSSVSRQRLVDHLEDRMMYSETKIALTCLANVPNSVKSNAGSLSPEAPLDLTPYAEESPFCHHISRRCLR